MGLFSLEDRLAFYGQYHHNAINKAIHIVFVPAILWTVMVWLSNVPLGEPMGWYAVPVNLSLVVTALFSAYYILLEPFAGSMYLPVLLGLHIAASTFRQTHADANWTALYIHIVSWAFQFLGHGLAERRAPALLDNLEQALVLAPFFVWLEVLFLLGYRPNLRARVESRILREIAAWKATLSRPSSPLRSSSSPRRSASPRHAT